MLANKIFTPTLLSHSLSPWDCDLWMAGSTCLVIVLFNKFIQKVQGWKMIVSYA